MHVARCALGASEEPSKENIQHFFSSGFEPVKVSAVKYGWADRCDPPRRSRAFWSMHRAVREGGLPAPHPQAEPRTSALVSPSVDRHFSSSCSFVPPQRWCLRYEEFTTVGELETRPGAEGCLQLRCDLLYSTVIIFHLSENPNRGIQTWHILKQRYFPRLLLPRKVEGQMLNLFKVKNSGEKKTKNKKQVRQSSNHQLQLLFK